MTKRFSIKKLVAGVLAAAMVVTALPVSGLSVKAADVEVESVKVYRSYNPNDGEHLYTTDVAEHTSLVAAGRSDEGVKFVTPATSNTPVYRVYNPNSGEHLLVSKGEAEGLAAIGWSNESIKMYSDDNKGVPIYRVYNPNAKDAGAHLYTASKDEATYLVSLGWSWDNNGEPMLYGLNEEVKQDLALEKVEGADAGTLTTLVAYFNKPVGDLQPGDIQIRKVSDDELVTVEKVVMSSDKLTATLSLVGASTGAGATLLPNTDYNMIVTANGETAEKVFSIPQVDAEGVVVGANPLKKQIITQGGSNPGTFTDNTGIIKDYNEILGRTVTTTFDQDANITKLVVKNEKVIYTAIKGKDTNSSGNVDTIVAADKSEYQLVGNGDTGMAGATTTIYTTRELRLDEDGAKFAGVATTAVAGNPADVYAKIVLNGNNTVRTLVVVSDWEKSVYVASVKDDKYLVDASGAYTDLTDYNIIKDGKTATIKDVKEGDVVFVNTAGGAKVAEIFNDNKVSGKMTVYTGKVDIGDTRYDLSGSAVIGENVVAATTANLTDYTGAEVEAYLNRAGALAQIIVSSTTAKTSSQFVILTEDAKIYTESADVIVSFKAGNGKSIDTYKLNVADLKSLKVGTSDIKYAKGTVEPDAAPAGGFAGTFGLGSNNDVTIGTDLVAGDLVKVIKDADNKIVGLELSNGTAADYDFDDANDQDMPAANPTTAVDTFSGGHTSMDAAQGGQMIEATTPVYVYNLTNGTVTLYSYKDVNFTATTTGGGDEVRARFDGSKVAAFYMDETVTTLGTAAIKSRVRGIVDSVTLTADGANYAEIVLFVGNDKVTYKKFAQDVPSVGVAQGDFLDVNLTEDGKVFSVDDTMNTDSAILGEFVVETYHIDDQYILQTESGVTTTIVVQDADGNFATKTWSELGTLVDTIETITVATYGTSADYVDAIYVTLDDGTAMADALTDNELIAAIAEELAEGAGTLSTTTATNDTLTYYTTGTITTDITGAAGTISIDWDEDVTTPGSWTVTAGVSVQNTTAAANDIVLTATISSDIAGTHARTVTFTLTGTNANAITGHTAGEIE